MTTARAVGLALGLTLALAAVPARGEAERLSLAQLLERARRGNPGLLASAAASGSLDAQLAEARRSWLPTGDVTSMLAPAPEIRCIDPLMSGRDPKEACTTTNVSEATLNIKGIFTRTELRLVQPVFTFGKIDAGVSAATEGVAASREREAVALADLELNVRRAYWGLRLAEEVLATLDEGIGYLEDAQKKLEKDLADGTGTATVTDKLRLRTVRAEVEARRLEARRLGEVARAGLRALLGSEAPKTVLLDDSPLEPLAIPARPLDAYLEAARLSRPEVRMLQHAVAAKRQLAHLEERRLYPDVVLVGSAAYAYTSSVDNPKNAFASDPYNTAYVGLVAALRMPIDFGPKAARMDRAVADAHELEHRQTEALGGIAFEVERAWNELSEARERTAVVEKGWKAGKSWISAVAQNFAVGLAETRDFSDGLTAFFTMRVRYLQAVHDFNVAAAALTRATGAEP